MTVVPSTPTEVTELVAADAGHMVAPFGAFDELSTLTASFPLLKAADEVIVARLIAFMCRHHASLAVFHRTTIAFEVWLSKIERAINTSLIGAQREVRVIDSLLPQQIASTFMSVVFRKREKGLTLERNWTPTALLRTMQILVRLQLIDYICIQTTTTKFVWTATH